MDCIWTRVNYSGNVKWSAEQVIALIVMIGQVRQSRSGQNSYTSSQPLI